MTVPACLSGRWHGCWNTFNGPLLMTLLGLPLPALVVSVLASFRWAAGVTSAWRISVAEVRMVYGTVPMVWLTLQRGSQAGVAPARVSLIPLRDLVTMGPIGIGCTGWFRPGRGGPVSRARR